MADEFRPLRTIAAARFRRRSSVGSGFDPAASSSGFRPWDFTSRSSWATTRIGCAGTSRCLTQSLSELHLHANIARIQMALIAGGGTGIGRASRRKTLRHGFQSSSWGEREQPLRGRRRGDWRLRPPGIRFDVGQRRSGRRDDRARRRALGIQLMCSSNAARFTAIERRAGIPVGWRPHRRLE